MRSILGVWNLRVSLREVKGPWAVADGRDVQEHPRSRIDVFLALSLSLSLAFVVWGLLHGDPTLVRICALSSIVSVLGLLCRERSPSLAAQLLLGSWLLGLSLGTLCDGATAGGVVWITLLPLLASGLVGWRATAAWSLASVLALGGVLLLEEQASFPQIDSLGHAPLALSAAGLVAGLVTFMSWDRTQWMQEIQRSNQALALESAAHSEAVVRAEQALTTQRMFTAMVSHDLRTPLTGLIGIGELLRCGALTPRQHEQVGVMIGAGEQLLRTVEALLDVARADAGSLRLRTERFEPRRMLSELSGLLQTLCAERGMSLECVTDPAVPRWIEGDQERVCRILVNLVGNAVRHAVPGLVVARLGWSASRLLIEVIDDGPGLPPEVRARLGQRLSHGLEQPGAGLGLYVVHALAETMGGEVRVDSPGGDRTAFRVFLPLAQAAPPAADQPCCDREAS